MSYQTFMRRSPDPADPRTWYGALGPRGALVLTRMDYSTVAALVTVTFKPLMWSLDTHVPVALLHPSQVTHSYECCEFLEGSPCKTDGGSTWSWNMEDALAAMSDEQLMELVASKYDQWMPTAEEMSAEYHEDDREAAGEA